MTYIPDCRKDPDYNEKNLKREEKMILAGYDFAFEDMFRFFENLDVYKDDFDIDGEDINLIRLLYNHPEIRSMLESCFADWVEMQRNEMIVSFLDDYGEDLPCDDMDDMDDEEE